MSDLISRAELFNRLAGIKAGPEANEYKAEVYAIINGLPTAEHTGKWVYRYIGIGSDAVERYEYRCSECGALPWADVERGENLHDYCPKCGARMKGGDVE